MTSNSTPITAGVHSYLIYGVESTYKTKGTLNKNFGIVNNFSVDVKNALNERRGFANTSASGRRIRAYAPGERSYDLSIDFDVTDFEFMEHVLGAVTGTTTKTYVDDDSVDSISIGNELDCVNTDRENWFTGCCYDSVTLKAAINEPLSCSAKLTAAHAEYDATLTARIAAQSVGPYTFVGAIFELPNATAIVNIVESFDITINNNYNYLRGSAKEITAATKGALDVTLKFSTAFVDDSFYTKTLGSDGVSAVTNPTENATVEITLKRGSSTVIILGTLAPIESYNLAQQLNSPVKEDITLKLQYISIAETV